MRFILDGNFIRESNEENTFNALKKTPSPFSQYWAEFDWKIVRVVLSDCCIDFAEENQSTNDTSGREIIALVHVTT